MVSRSKIAVMTAITFATLHVATECGNPGVYAKVCEDTELNVRADERECEKRSTSERYRWLYFKPGRGIPAIGQELPDRGETSEPDDAEQLVRIPPEGGRAGEVIEHE